MKIKFLDVLDEGTEEKYIILQTEEVDSKFFHNNISPGYKIVIQVNGSKVAAAGGINFFPDYLGDSIADQSYKIEASGTSNALGLLLNSVEDVKTLPDIINIDELRESCIALNNRYITIKTELDEFEKEQGISLLNDSYKKVLYSSNSSLLKLAIVDMDYAIQYSISYKDSNIIGDFLWIPLEELSENEYKKFQEVNGLEFCKQIANF